MWTGSLVVVVGLLCVLAAMVKCVPEGEENDSNETGV